MTRISEPAAAAQAGTPQSQGRLHTLHAKLRIPMVGLMIASLLLSTVAFVIGTTRTQDQLLEQQIQSDTQRVQQALIARADQMITAARMLPNDSIVNEAIRCCHKPLVPAMSAPSSSSNRAMAASRRWPGCVTCGIRASRSARACGAWK